MLSMRLESAGGMPFSFFDMSPNWSSPSREAVGGNWRSGVTITRPFATYQAPDRLKINSPSKFAGCCQKRCQRRHAEKHLMSLCAIRY